jgi:FixJ family two-component response regulator
MQSAFPLQIQTFSEAIDLQPKCHKLPIIVLSYNNDVEMAKAAISHGAKGYGNVGI